MRKGARTSCSRGECASKSPRAARVAGGGSITPTGSVYTQDALHIPPIERTDFDIEPGEAGAAFALFGKPGTPAALAALAVGYAAKQDEPEAPKGGPLAKEAALLCRNPAFREWLMLNDSRGSTCTEEEAAREMRDCLGISSRSEIDGNHEKAAQFIDWYRVPFMRWRRERATA